MSVNTCPHICPKNVKSTPEETKMAQPKSTLSQKGYSTYVPGEVKPYEPVIYQSHAPPGYLPQPDETNGDILVMSSLGPWASGHLDWSPHAGSTGTRPVVDKYSITRYSTGEWRKNNQRILTPRATDKSAAFQKKGTEDIQNAFSNLKKEQDNSNKMLEDRVKVIEGWQAKVKKAVGDITKEIRTLETYRMKLKSASRILMLPEAISRECLELRTHRYEPDLVRDNAEQELIKEVAIIAEIRRVFNETLAEVEHQMLMNKAAKAAIESDWSDKDTTLKLDRRNLSLTPDSNLILFHPGATRAPGNDCSLDYWNHYCSESVRNCEDIRKKSADLRANLMSVIVNGGQDLKTQADRTNTALRETIEITEALCEKLEQNLKDALEKIAELENFIDYLKDSIRKINMAGKMAQTRLNSRNYDRPNVENCYDDAQKSILHEAKVCKETIDQFTTKIREADAIRAEIMKYRGDLEKDIACKRKSLSIDRDRFTKIRAFFPTAEEFASL